MRLAAGLLVSICCLAAPLAAAPPEDAIASPKVSPTVPKGNVPTLPAATRRKVTKPAPVQGGKAAEAADVLRERTPDSLRNRNRVLVPEKPEPALRPELGIPSVTPGSPKCGPGVWPLAFELHAEPMEVWPGDSLALRWRTVGPGNTGWRDPVHLVNGATGRRERVAPVSTLRLPASSLREPETLFTLETTCKTTELRVAVVPAPSLSALSPSPYVCQHREGPDQCPGTLELLGSDFGAVALPGSRVSIWREPAYKFAVRVRSWSDSRVQVEMPSEMRPGPWYAQLRRGVDATRNRDSAVRPFEVRVEAVPVVEQRRRPSPGFAPPTRTRGSGGGGSEGEGCEAGTPCTVQPRSCAGRPELEVAGTTRCSGSTAECVAVQGTDYCSVCGGHCGGCVGHSCSATTPCAPGSICRLEHGPTGTTLRCAAIRDSSVAFSQPCTPINGYCWMPGELGTDESATMICAEAR